MSKDYIEAAKKLLAEAEQGNAQAQYQLAVFYHNGQGVPKNYTEAAKWYEKAAQQGHTKAALYLGMLYQNGVGVEQNYHTAQRWYTKAANDGDIQAKLCLGNLYYVGTNDGQVIGYAQAKRWYEEAADKGNTQAQQFLKKRMIPDTVTKEILDRLSAIPNALAWFAIIAVVFFLKGVVIKANNQYLDNDYWRFADLITEVAVTVFSLWLALLFFRVVARVLQLLTDIKDILLDIQFNKK